MAPRVFLCHPLSSGYFVISLLLPLVFMSETVPKSAENVTPGMNTEVKEDCQIRLDNFAESVGSFTFCAIQHARPIRLCELCVVPFIKVKQTHDAILQLEDWSGNTCKLELINLDRLEIIESTFNNANDLWSRGKCNNCFSFKDGNLTSELSNNTREFQRLSTDNEDCFQKFNSSLEPASNVCTNCREKYCDMNEFYNQIKLESGDGDICIDIVDTMNSTRLKWSEAYGCSLNKMQLDISFIVAVCVVTLCPVVFYVAAKVYSVKTETKLLRQNRLSRQLSNPRVSGFADGFSTPSSSRMQPSGSRET